MKLIANLAILLVSTAYFFVGLLLVEAMESTKVADFGYNVMDVYLFVFACILMAFGTLGFMFVALQRNPT